MEAKTSTELIRRHYQLFLTQSNACRSPRAVRDYLLSIEMFEREAGPDFLSSTTCYRDFHTMLESLAERTQWPDGRAKKIWGARTIYKTATECVVFFRWALAFGYTKFKITLDDPPVGHLFRKGVSKPPEYFDWNDPDLLKLLNDPNNTLKKKAIYELMRSTGIRPCEFERLLKTDYQKNVLNLTRRKGGKPGFAPIDSKAQKCMDEYLECLNWHYQGPWLFPRDNYSGPISGHGLYKMMRNHGQKLGIKFYPYRLRHSLPGELCQLGHNALVISEVMGHGDPRTTKIYTHLSKQMIKKIYEPVDQVKI